MPRKKQAPAPLGGTDPKAPTPPEDLNPETQETETPTPDPQPTPTPDPEPKQSEDPEADPMVEVVVVHPEAPPPEPAWKPIASRSDEHVICEACELQARQLFKVTFRYRDPESGKVMFIETMDRLNIIKDPATGEYTLQSRM